VLDYKGEKVTAPYLGLGIHLLHHPSQKPVRSHWENWKLYKSK